MCINLMIRYDGRLLGYLVSIWRIWFPFYGSFFASLGSMIFALRCPVAIKKYSDGFAMSPAEAVYHAQLGCDAGCIDKSELKLAV
jgi:hypothetical protein